MHFFHFICLLTTFLLISQDVHGDSDNHDRLTVYDLSLPNAINRIRIPKSMSTPALDQEFQALKAQLNRVFYRSPFDVRPPATPQEQQQAIHIFWMQIQNKWKQARNDNAKMYWKRVWDAVSQIL